MNMLSMRFVGAAAGVLMIALLGSPTPGKARMVSAASIIGPATVEDDALCTWDSSTGFEGTASYEWTLSNDLGTTVVSTGPYVVLRLDKSLGTHQGLDLRITQGANVELASKLIGVYFQNVGTPDCSE